MGPVSNIDQLFLHQLFSKTLNNISKKYNMNTLCNKIKYVFCSIDKI